MINSAYYDYFIWLTNQIDCYEFPVDTYSQLLNDLFDVDFVPIVPTDEDRGTRGLERRRDYFMEYAPDFELYEEKCSMLEMMIALAYDCEDCIMHEPGKDQTPIWFWIMIESLGLIEMDNSNYKKVYVARSINRYLRGRYDRDGRHGLFWCRGYPGDLRGTTIWFQLNRWLSINFDFSL